ncbi:Aspartyl/glutamyl-tRNA(Asn/Gln) amidotransferase subunit C [Chlamydiales bacterium STE3]|nr:Aspartyl/glutamyl-tRNA(Asn/Gln) amidotransferase subunit C [Chlamydiales bacterium STE3]
MANLDKEAIKSLTHLCKIQCTEEEEESLLQDLQKILLHIEQLNEIDTENVMACNHVVEIHENVWRDDTIGECLPREIFLSNAPAQVGGLVRVPPVIKST